MEYCKVTHDAIDKTCTDCKAILVSCVIAYVFTVGIISSFSTSAAAGLTCAALGLLCIVMVGHCIIANMQKHYKSKTEPLLDGDFELGMVHEV